MLYAHVLLTVIVALAAIFASAIVALFAAANLTNDPTAFKLLTGAIWIVLSVGSAPVLSGLFAKSVPGRCVSCNTWATYLLRTLPISYRCSACGERTKLSLFFSGGLTQDCPSCAGRGCFVYTGSTRQSPPEPLLEFRCRECGHLGYCESPPPDMA